MAIIRKIVDATVIIDNTVVAYVPNSLDLTEGFGEQKIRTQTGGGGSVQSIVADDITKKHSKVQFKMEPTADNLALLRTIKADQNGHVITLSAPGFYRTVTNAILTSDYEVKLGVDDTIQVVFMGSAAV